MFELRMYELSFQETSVNYKPGCRNMARIFLFITGAFFSAIQRVHWKKKGTGMKIAANILEHQKD
jgi:hypothetical protein